MNDPRQLPAMWKLFASLMASGLVMGVVTPLVAFGLAARGRLVFVAVSLLLGLSYAFAMYIFVKGVLRTFVRKLHTLERIVVGTLPPRLPNVFRSNEIDEVEQSAARIIAELDAARASAEARS